MTEVSTSKWDELLQSAEEKKLTTRERQAQVLAHLNYQVQNGGFSQWVDNGYASEEGRAVLKILRGSSNPSMRLVSKMVTDVMQFVIKKPSKGIMGDYLKNGSDSGSTRFYEFCEPLSDQFYEINEEFMMAVEIFLSTEE